MFNKISSQERVDFTKNLSVMLKSGIAINEALGSLAQQSRSKRFRRILQNIKSDAERGTSLSEAFSAEQKVFGNIFVGLIRAGEASGTLEENLSFLSDWLEYSSDLIKEIQSVMLYPKIVLGATLVLGGGLAVFILPRLAPLFGQFRIELPLPTKMLLAISIFVGKFWPLLVVGMIGAVFLAVFLPRIRIVARFLDFLFLKAPFVRGLAVDYQLALLTQVFFTLSHSGLSINEMLDMGAQAATNVHYRESLSKMKERVSGGTMLAEAMKEYPGLYPPNMVSIVATGEKSGTLEQSFLYLAEFYSKEVRSKTKKLPTLIEPALLIFIGCAIGFVSLAIILPIYRLTSGLSQ